MAKDYNAMYEQAQKDESVKRLSPKRIKFEEGNTIVGEYLGRTQLESKDENMPDFFVYTFETNEGPVQFPVAQAFDKQDGERLKKGGVYALHHGGYMKLDKDRKVKVVDVDIIEEAKGEEGESP